MSPSPIVALLSLLSLAAIVVPLRQDPEPAVAETVPTSTEGPLTELEFMCGLWVGGSDQTVMQERWERPLGDTIVGTFRLVQDGIARFHEYLLIEHTEADGIRMWIRHFDPNSVAWAGDPVEFRLTSNAEQRAVFDANEGETKTRLIYQRTDDALVATLEKTPADGKPRRSEFRFRLAPADLR